MSDPFEYLRLLLVAVRAALTLNPQLFSTVYDYPGSLQGLPLWVVIGAGVSLMLGQSVVLFANRVRPARFWISILLGALNFALKVTATAAVVWLIANSISAHDLPFLQTTRAVALAYAPYWLGILILIPYLGPIIEQGIRLWVFLALIVAMQTIFSLTFFQGVLAAVIAFLIERAIELTLGRLLTPLTDRLTRMVTGVDDRKSVHDLYLEFVSRSPKD